MDARLVLHVTSSVLPCLSQHNMHRRRCPRAVSAMTSPTQNVERLTTLKTEYKDNWFDSIAINHLSKSVQETIGFKSSKKGYDGLVEATTAARQHFSPDQQRQLVIQALDKAFPKPILSLIRTVLPPSKLQREYFAAFTTIFFPWLVGPCEVKESEFNGKHEKNVVHIKKMFLEESNCVNMCTNLCKMPSQAFIKDSFGIPVNMVPNFDDMSCEMIFGQEPPAQSDDPAFKQPCYKLCNAKQKHSTSCTS
ncbi:hypothetical protein DCAR_0521107 [Daucus carota subsp. sativus]|uniref:Beta-carotene isomerase D27-like C-terminal domain-containing protein n=1 Tax=Daucus carota subsp. sativus TaxID=79200 RepID=A0AAF0X767_DAUCS|nr:hypothetical protein DCAR_0521107 [Daucus carota subsp. sativus]